MKNMVWMLRDKPLKDLDSAQLTLLLLGMVEDKKDQLRSVEDIQFATTLAAHLHSGQTRSNRANFPRTPYIEHPLRNTIRVMRWGCYSQAIITACILHDVVEDSAEGIYTLIHHTEPPAGMSEDDLRDVAIQFIEDRFGTMVASIVLDVSNGILPKETTRAERHVIYREHVAEVIHDNPAVFLVKLSDFVDNAVGLYHNNIEINRKRVSVLAGKYLPLIEVFRKELYNLRDKLEISGEAFAQIEEHLNDAENRLTMLVNQK